MAQYSYLSDDEDCPPVLAETVKFELDGIQYEIDLSHESAVRMRGRLEPWIAAARRTGGRRRLRPVIMEPPNPADAAARRRVEIRLWAHDNGYGVAVYGRIPRHVIDAYQAATAETVLNPKPVSGIMVRPTFNGPDFVVL